MIGRPVSVSAAVTTIPSVVVDRVRDGLVHGLGSGIPFLDLPFSCPEITALMADVEMRLRRVLDIPPDYEVLFAQGGAYAHFALVAMNLLAEGEVADYVETGLWARRAIDEAAKVALVTVAASSAGNGYRAIPPVGEWRLSPDAAYLHITSTESAQGVQFRDFPELSGGPLVADMTGDFLTRPIDVSRFGLIYASAQKSLGAAGLTIVIIRRDLLRPHAAAIPAVFDYRRLVEARSRVNTPPVFALYLADEMLRWIEGEGGLPELAERRGRRCERLYRLLDSSPIFRCRVRPEYRSAVSLCFDAVDPGRHAAILGAAAAHGLEYLDGHPAVGGFRLAIHNGHAEDDIDRIAEFLESIK